ncbi:MAG: DUF4262 domain-containing protein [Planctomycetota bacterium]
MDEVEVFRADVRAAIAEHGWHIVLIPAEDDRPAYGFTIGLTDRFAHPEICVVGLDDGEDGGLMHDLLDSAAEMVAEGERIEAGVRNAKLLVGHSLGVRAMQPDQIVDWLALAVVYRGKADVEAIQLLWPDRRGRLPFESGCERRVVELQPILG